jgi:RsiW-degrading membrane proteinase PrsW (M82 family)
MAIEFACGCGRKLHAPAGSEGRKGQCPTCKSVVVVPAGQPAGGGAEDSLYELKEPAAAPRPVRPAPPAAAAPQATPSPAGAGRPLTVPLARTWKRESVEVIAAPPPLRSVRSYWYLLLLCALIPLVVSVFLAHETLEDQIARTAAAHPDVVATIADKDFQSLDELCAYLPGHRLEGALLPRESELHWLLAFVAAGIWIPALLLLFPRSRRDLAGTLLSALFTATCGVVLLLAFQFLAFHMPTVGLRFGKLGIILLLIKLIGLSYAMADSDFGFLASFLGYTCGAGLCEEVTKALPLLWRVKGPGEGPSWDELFVRGLASGIGFGIVEGIMYAGHYYNGVDGAGIYVVRFFSCVVLHAVWSGSVAVTMYNHQEWLEGADNGWMYCLNVVRIVWIPMALHGLYDTLLKQEHEGIALLAALGSFGWFAWQVERMKRTDEDAPHLAS